MRTHGVTVRGLRVLCGPNLYAYLPVLEITLDIGSYETRPSSDFPGFTERLTEWLPGLQKHECSVGRPGGFIERLQRGTYLAHICEHITLELQTLMGFNVAYGRARGTGKRGVYRVVIEYQEEEPARAAFETALRLTLAAMHDEPFDTAAEVELLMALADRYRLGPSTAAIVAAARKRRIPVLRVTPQDSLVQLGYGVHQKRILASQTSYTGAIGVELCQDKSLTNHMLRRVGVPVPEGRVVKSAKDAWQAAQEVGMPVVVKPVDGNQGKGVSVNLTRQEEVGEAYKIARQFSKEVLVERSIEGHDFRLLVVNGKLVAAARRDPAQVVGDGEHTVAQLVEILNRDPRRRPGHGSTLTRIELNEAVTLTLEQQGMALDSVPAAGQPVKLRNNSNLSTGGTATDVTDEVHPSNVRLAELAAQILTLDITGIDMVCQDISRPLAEQDGAIVEVNAAPGLRMHLHPSEGQPRNVGAPIVDMLYPGDSPARIPIIAVTGTNGKTTVTRLVSHMYETGHWMVGMTCTDGIYIGREMIMKGDCSGPKSAQAVLLHPYVEVAVLETARGGILREGLAFDQCLVGVVTNVTADHLGLGGVDELGELARVKQVVVEAVSRDGAAVLNAEDPLVAEMAAATDAAVIYFSQSARNYVMAAHLAGGGRGVFVDEGMIVLATGEERVDLVELARVPFTLEGRIAFQVMNALAATAAAWAAGLSPAIIARALTTFVTSTAAVPGRFNLVNVGDVEVILDYGHNPAALKALGQAVGALEPRRTVMSITLPGDRRDEDLIESMRATFPYVDEYVIYDAEDLRGRRPNEVPQIMCGQLPPDMPCTVVAGQQQGILAAWQHTQPGERLIVICDEVDEALEILHAITRSINDDASCVNPLAPLAERVFQQEGVGSPVSHGPSGNGRIGH